MFPPRLPKSPRLINSQVQTHIPIPNRKSRQKQFNHKNQTSTMRSKVSKYQNLKSAKQKRLALGRIKYINQLAQMDYEDKHIEVHTKYSTVSKVSALKKIKAKNQIAEFMDEEQQQQVGFEELMDYKYGRHNNQSGNFFFEKDQIINDYQFCSQCDSIHNDHPQVHQKICKQKIFQKSNQFNRKDKRFVSFCLERIINILERMNAQEYDQLKRNLLKLQQGQQTKQPKHLQYANSEKCLRQISELAKVNKQDQILTKIVYKVHSLFKQ